MPCTHTCKAPYPVIMEELNGSEDIKLACHEELYSQVPRQRGYSMLSGPLGNFLQKLLSSLKRNPKDNTISRRK